MECNLAFGNLIYKELIKLICRIDPSPQPIIGGRTFGVIALLQRTRLNVQRSGRSGRYQYKHSNSSFKALLRKAFRSPGVLVLGDFGIFCLFLPRASREVK